MTTERYRVVQCLDRVFPVRIIDTRTRRVCGRYYRTSERRARQHCFDLNRWHEIESRKETTSGHANR